MKQTSIARNLALALAVLLAAAGTAPPAEAQQPGERMTILVPNLAPQQGVRDRFGKDVARELRRAIDRLDLHQPVSDRDMNRARRQYDLSEEQLYNCVTARQLAMQQGWDLVLCGEYEPAAGGEMQVTAAFVGAESGERFEVPAFTAGERAGRQAAERILETFDRWQTQARHALFCRDYMESEDWEQALRNCEQALAINPEGRSALYMKALILRETDRREEALATVEQVLELDPIDQDALKTAGILATELNQREQAREYFDRYMELNPGDVAVRLAIATDINNAGDPEEALRIALAGADGAEDNINLQTYIGHFAAAAAARAEQAASGVPGTNGTSAGPAPDPARVTELYQIAAQAYERVFEAQGEETEPAILERLIVAKTKLGDTAEAVTLGRRATQARPDEARVWDAYARALLETGDTEAALQAITRTEELGHQSAGLTQRKATIQLQAGNAEAAVQTLQRGVEGGQFNNEQAFSILFRHAYQDRMQQGQLDQAFRMLDAAGPLAQADNDRLTRNFWRGYILFQQGQRAMQEQNAQTAARAKPMFERALELFRQSSGYERVHASANVPQFIENTQRFIEIADALIRRGR